MRYYCYDANELMSGDRHLLNYDENRKVNKLIDRLIDGIVIQEERKKCLRY